MRQKLVFILAMNYDSDPSYYIHRSVVLFLKLQGDYFLLEERLNVMFVN